MRMELCRYIKIRGKITDETIFETRPVNGTPSPGHVIRGLLARNTCKQSRNTCLAVHVIRHHCDVIHGLARGRHVLRASRHVLRAWPSTYYVTYDTYYVTLHTYAMYYVT
jgi:hypothetical protein